MPLPISCAPLRMVSPGGLSGRTADMGVAVGCFCLIAVVAC